MKTIKTDTKPNIGKRILAGVVDYLIISIVGIILIYTLGKPDIEGSYELNGFPALIPILFWLFMTVGVEQLLGVTLGNYTMDLKAISLNGNQNNLSFGQSIKRHILDPIDMFFFGVVGIITIKNTPKNQRLGDIWANTIVIDTKQKN